MPPFSTARRKCEIVEGVNAQGVVDTVSASHLFRQHVQTPIPGSRLRAMGRGEWVSRLFFRQQVENANSWKTVPRKGYI